MKSAATAAASLLLTASSYALLIARIFWVICRSGVLVYWANAGKAKLIANPIRASNRIFIVSYRCFRNALSPNDLLRDFFSESRVTSLSQGQEERLWLNALSGSPLDASTYSASKENAMCLKRQCRS